DGQVSFGTKQPVGTCSLTLPLPLPPQVQDGAAVVVEFQQDGSWWADPVFSGTFRNPALNLTTQGATATLTCEGSLYRMTYPLEQDIAYAGGAKSAPVALSLGAAGTYLHLGTQVITWYADDS